jgi:Lipid A 3-O-deacylase (PagL)
VATLRSLRRVALILLALPLLSPMATTQDSSSSAPRDHDDPIATLHRGTNEFGVWSGFSPFSFVLKGTAEDRRLFLLNLQYARTLFVTRPVTLKYTAEIVPAAVEIQPTQYYEVGGQPLTNPAGSIYAAGASPIGFQGNFGRKNIQPFANGSVGFLYFTQQVPIIGSSQFNYTVSIGFGAQFFRRSGRTFTLGWKYFHLSNDYQAPLNPGIDSGVFYAAFSILRGGR